jgi:DNA-binding NtrC family response regulator
LRLQLLEMTDGIMPVKDHPRFRPTLSSPPCHRVLLVDEDADELKFFATWLWRMNYSVRAFRNFQEAAESLECEYFDFVIVSQGGPAFETQRLVELTLARDPYTPVVVLTR